MRWGVCTEIARAGVLKEAGWDFVEENVQTFLKVEPAEDPWKPATGVLPVEAGCLLVPRRLKIVGPEADVAILREYMERVVTRAGQAGMKILVFGSGRSRMVPEGFSREAARRQILDFSKMAAELAATRGLTVVLEPLNQGECNIINSVAEAMEYVNAVAHPHFACLVDSYHMWKEHEGLESVAAAGPRLCHVHVADLEGRVAPGVSGGAIEAEYLKLFATLKASGYDQRVSLETSPAWKPATVQEAAEVLGRIKTWWARA